MNSNWSYSPETPNLGQIPTILAPCDLEIWWMTLNKANLRDLKAGLPTSKIFFPYFVEKISVFWVTFPYPLICSSPDSKHSWWQLPIYSGGTHPLPVETLVDSFGTTGTGSWQERMLLPHVEERRLNVLVIKEVFEGFKALNATKLDWIATQNR